MKTDLGKSTVTDRTPVEYPEAALEKKVQGTVVVEATVDQTGSVNDARVVSGPQELRKAALQSVLEWHFTPDSAGNKRRVSISFQTPPAGSPVPVEYDGVIHRYQQQQSQQEIQDLQHEIERVQKNLEHTQALPQAKQEIADLEKQLELLRRSGYTEDHPDIRKLKKELEVAQVKFDAQGAALITPAPADEEYRKALQGVAQLKAQLNLALRAQELENGSQDGNDDAVRRKQQVLETREFIEQQLKQAELQVVETERLAQEQQAQQEKAQPQQTEWEIFQRLRESQQAFLREQVSRGAQLTEQLKILQAQMEALRAQADALKAQLQEQQKSQQK